MANKGINYMISEAKDELLQKVNELVSKGIPITVIELMLINLSTSISEVSKTVVIKEQNQFNDEVQKEMEEEEKRLREEHKPD